MTDFITYKNGMNSRQIARKGLLAQIAHRDVIIFLLEQ